MSLEIFPEILHRYPEARLEIVGACPVPEVLELAEFPNIKVTGEAMAAGVPVVGSESKAPLRERALLGLKVDKANVPLRAMRANTLSEYVYAIGRLFAEPKLREKLSTNGRTLVETEYTWEKIDQRYENVIQKL